MEGDTAPFISDTTRGPHSIPQTALASSWWRQTTFQIKAGSAVPPSRREHAAPEGMDKEEEEKMGRRKKEKAGRRSRDVRGAAQKLCGHPGQAEGRARLGTVAGFPGIPEVGQLGSLLPETRYTH